MRSEYRERFSEFHREARRAELAARLGADLSGAGASRWGEYSDLFTTTRIEELRAAMEAVSPSRETERAGLRLLLAFASEGWVGMRAREVAAELDRYHARARIAWGGEELDRRQASALLAVETDAARRRDLFARIADLSRGADDLRAQQWAERAEGVRLLGYASAVEMREALFCVDLRALDREAERLLAKTETAYVAALAGLASRELGVSIDEASEADLPFLRRYPRFDRYFPGRRMVNVYRDLFGGLGFSTWSQSQVEVDATSRPTLSNRSGRASRAFCVPIQVPDEIRLVVGDPDGQAGCAALLRAAGQAQHAAWTSRNLPPEFRIGGDPAVREAWGLLFENLLEDDLWLATTWDFAESDAFRHARGLLRWLGLRLDAARLHYQLDVFSAGTVVGAGPRYAEAMTEAARLSFGASGHLQELDAEFAPARRLRAAAFESQLRDHLKTRFGRRWWSAPKAGEMLIDLWNTGQRYSVEELAGMIGLGALDFDWLVSLQP